MTPYRWQAPAPDQLKAAEHAFIVALCGYELTAICSRGRVPTITRMHSQNRAVGVTLIAYLTWHFAQARRPVPPI